MNHKLPESARTIHEIAEIVAECRHLEYEFSVTQDRRGAMYLQATYLEADVDSGRIETQVTRRWFLNPEMTRSEIVQTVFKCVMTSMEHRTREWFSYRGKAVFGPHFDVDVLWEICHANRYEYRQVISEVKP